MIGMTMVSDRVTKTERFLSMSEGAQLLYFHIAACADAAGYVSTPSITCNQFEIARVKERLGELYEKGYLISVPGMEEGERATFLKHYFVSNTIDRKRFPKASKISADIAKSNFGFKSPKWMEYMPLSKGDCYEIRTWFERVIESEEEWQRFYIPPASHNETAFETQIQSLREENLSEENLRGFKERELKPPDDSARDTAERVGYASRKCPKCGDALLECPDGSAICFRCGNAIGVAEAEPTEDDETNQED